MDHPPRREPRSSPVPLAPRTPATPLSRGIARDLAPPPLAAMARASLLGLAVTMSSTACLITDAPTYKAPDHTKPYLDPASADPSTRDVVIVDSVELATTSVLKSFSADVQSQDDPADSTGLFREVQTRLYIDYGFKGNPQAPWRYAFSGNTLPPGGTLDTSTGRRVSASWAPGLNIVERGCHTATLVVSHMFQDVNNCPKCEDDYSTITWQIMRCDKSKPGDCESLPLTGDESCAALTTSCEEFNAKHDAGTCPEETADGGAP